MYGLVRGIGMVRAVEDGRVVVRMPLDGGGAELCKTSCEGCALCDRGKVRHLDLLAAVRDGVPPEPGQQVVVEYRRRDPALAAILFFLPPLIGLALGGHILNRFVGGGDWMFLAGALAGFVAGALVSLCLSRFFPRLVRPEAKILEYR